MATNFLNFKNKHAVVGTSELLSTIGGSHIRNIEATADIDNGCIVGCGEYLRPDVQAEAVAGTFAGTIIDKTANGNWLIDVESAENCWLVAQVPMIYEEYTTQCQHESNFYNAQGDIMRCMELLKYDRFEVSAEAISGEVAKGAKVSVTNKKLTIG